jgi:hypothetical protein
MPGANAATHSSPSHSLNPARKAPGYPAAQYIRKISVNAVILSAAKDLNRSILGMQNSPSLLYNRGNTIPLCA